MADRLFDRLDVYHDADSRSAAMNMAIDEALLENATEPTIRFYRWDRPALSFGYFGRFSDVKDFLSERMPRRSAAKAGDIVRRWTGGGIVFHGEDLTYSLVIPENDRAFRKSSMSIYERVHRAIQHALVSTGHSAELASVAAVYDRRRQDHPALIERRSSDCFTNPVRADVLLNGRKIAGAAQRRTRSGLLQQGSIQQVDLGNDFANLFAGELSTRVSGKSVDAALVERAHEIARLKYGREDWLKRR